MYITWLFCCLKKKSDRNVYSERKDFQECHPFTLKWRRETFFNKPPRHFQKIQRSVWEVPSFSQAWRPGMPTLRPAFWPWHHRPDSDLCSLQQSCLLLAGVPILDLPKPKSRNKKKKGRVSLRVRTWDHILNT